MMSDLPPVNPTAAHPARRGRVAAVGLLVLALALVGLRGGGRRWEALLAGRPGEAQAFEVPTGAPVAEIGRRLATAGLIRDGRAFALRARQRRLDGRLQAGWYRLDPTAGVDAILDTLASGRVATRKVTFPEGLDLRQAAERCAAAGIGPAAEYERLATAEAASFGLEGLPAGASLEGYLFPDTYLLPLDAGPRELLAAQVRRFVEVWRETSAGVSNHRPRHEIVIMASLIEKEVKRDEERAKVAGVIENRLARGMRLELCSTVLYALGEHKERLLYRDLRVASPYNTYLHAGLPPGPIASPGAASLAAALRPARHDWLFFVLTEDGRHLFARTAAEHQRHKLAGEKARGVR